MGKAAFRKLFLKTIAASIPEALPATKTRNAIRIQFALKFSLLIVFAFTQSIWVIPTSIHRTADEQYGRYLQGRERPGKIVTNTDGYRRKSKHQLWRAGDLLVLQWNGIALRSAWRPREPYVVLGEFWEQTLGGTWGGRWKERGVTKFDDPYHFEI